jgi:type IV pilus assembly protein PilP
MMLSNIRRIVPSLVLISLLGGCGDGGITEIKEWMDQTKRETRVSVPKLSPPKKFIPFAYDGKDRPDPFNPNKLAIAFARLQANSGNGLKPDLDRRREPLEAYPLDTLRMVGTLRKPGKVAALIQADKVVSQVTIGNHLGQNLGKVTAITENSVEITELIQDVASGEWVERKAKLELQEAGK